MGCLLYSCSTIWAKLYKNACFLVKYLHIWKKCCTFASAFEKQVCFPFLPRGCESVARRVLPEGIKIWIIMMVLIFLRLKAEKEVLWKIVQSRCSTRDTRSTTRSHRCRLRHESDACLRSPHHKQPLAWFASGTPLLGRRNAIHYIIYSASAINPLSIPMRLIFNF